MTSEEVVILTKYVKSMCPQQHMDTYTPDAWEDALSDLELFECRRAACEIAKRQPFIAPSEIRAEVRRIRDERLAHATLSAPSAEIADEPGQYQQAIRAQVRRIADGFSAQRAITGAPLPGEPPAEWAKAREALQPETGKEGPDPQARAREQVAESRRRRGTDIDDWGTGGGGTA